MEKLTETQKNFRKQMGELDEDYKSRHKNNNSKTIIITIIIFAIILLFLVIKFKSNSNNSNLFNISNQNQDYIYNYLYEYNPNEIILTYNTLVNRLGKDDYNIIKSDVKNELVYINFKLDKLNTYYPKEIIYNLHSLNILQLEELKYTYDLIINSNEYNTTIYNALLLYSSKRNNFRNELVKILDKYNFDYTIHKDGSMTFTYEKITY